MQYADHYRMLCSDLRAHGDTGSLRTDPERRKICNQDAQFDAASEDVSAPTPTSTLRLTQLPQRPPANPYSNRAPNLGLADTKFILVIIVVASNQPFALWLMRGFLITIPPELDEAARIDGCNMVQTVTRVILPIATPGIATASIFTFLLSYNEYLFALILTQKNAMTLPVAIGQYGAEDLSYWTLSAAGVVSIVIPICLVMIFLQKYLVKGMVAGAVKG